MVSGNPAELRNVSVKVRSAMQSLDTDLRAVESLYNSLRFDVPNKSKLDDLLRDTRVKLNAAKEQLAEFERRIAAVAQQLENVNRA